MVRAPPARFCIGPAVDAAGWAASMGAEMSGNVERVPRSTVVKTAASSETTSRLRDKNGDTRKPRLALHDEHRRIVATAARPREGKQTAAAARERRAAAQHVAQLPRLDVLVDTVAAKDQHLPAVQRNLVDVRRRHGAVADHAGRIIARTAGRRHFAQVAVRIVDGQHWRLLPARHPIDAAVADPGDQPPDNSIPARRKATVAALRPGVAQDARPTS
jgi:hypothetical protein